MGGTWRPQGTFFNFYFALPIDISTTLREECCDEAFIALFTDYFCRKYLFLPDTALSFKHGSEYINARLHGCRGITRLPEHKQHSRCHSGDQPCTGGRATSPI